MGVSAFNNWNEDEDNEGLYPNLTYESPNPNPNKFTIEQIDEIGEYCIALIHYFGCTSYNGRKVLVFELSKEELKSKDKIDPHFLEEDETLIARFPASRKGYMNAIALVEKLLMLP